ncbi:7TM diverse intracellular signaling domain-containing protein [Bernardetia sp.]|uniref:7TM diverse intracellular signaling domain-containing protein n=1 Tax=Bernardetia sp. TaxID=1937974 RepID=UPI0025C5F1F1|nr:7TM diverse intracellular signaling domain-containing protein [Bernardetia sp.]
MKNIYFKNNTSAISNISSKFFTVIVFLMVLFFINFVFAQPVPSILLEDVNKEYVITNQLGLYEEVIKEELLQENIQTIQKANFSVRGKDIVTLNSGNHVMWVKIPVQNNTDRVRWYLEIGNGLADIEAFISKKENPNEFEKLTFGYSLPFSERIIQTDRFLIPFDVSKNNKSTIYLRIESDYFQAPFRIAPLEYYFERDHKVDLSEGIYYGFVIVMALYNLFIFFTVREKGYLFYVFYLISLGLAMAQLRGHLFEFIFFATPTLNRYVPIIHSFVGIFASLFLINFLHTKKNSRVFHIILHIVIIIFCLNLVIGLLGFKPIASAINQVVAGLSSINALVAAIYIYYKGYKPAKFIILAWSFYLLGVVVFVLAGADIIPYNTFNSSAMLWGSAIEMILLSVALAAKIEYYKKDREALQVKMLEDSEKHREFVETQNKRLEQRVNERTEELNVVNEELSVNLERLHEQNVIIEKKNHDITASINYAKRIQNAMLPTIEEIKSVLPKSFIFFEPRDIVSGDFYYFKEIHNKIIIGAIDCTGHGVPGAFMSLIGNDLLNEIVESKSVTQASHILDKLDEGVTKVLRQTNTQIRDGMDAAFCVYDTKTKQIEYAGARNPLIYIKDEELKVIRADRQSVGGNLVKNQITKKLFTNHVFNFLPNTTFYLFSDGFQDQFGGKDDRKFTVKRFRNMLLEASKLPFSEQEQFLNDTLKNWKGYNNRQIDDILVFGFNFSQ